MYSPTLVTKAMAEAIVTCRDFCGNEAEAAADAYWDATDGLDPSTDEHYPDLLFDAQTRADLIWRESQKQAGVPEKYWKR